MYHNITPAAGEGLTIGIAHFEAQCKHLVSEGYVTHHFSDILKTQQLSAKRNCVITFDDAYVNQMEYALPILQKYKLKATFFVPLAYLGKTDMWNTGDLEVMDGSQLQSLPTATIELAYHSYDHQKYNELSSEEIEVDTQRCFEVAEENGLQFTPILAYPYGKFPRREPQQSRFFQQLQDNGLQLGLRIGNRVEKFPFRNPFELNRIDVKGEWGLLKFKRRLKFAKIF